MSHCRGIDPHFKMRWGTRCSFQVEAGNSGFLLICDGNLGEPLELPKESQESFRVVRGNSGLLSSRLRGIYPHFTLEGGESHGFSQLVVGNSGFLSNCDDDVGEPLVLTQGSQASIRVTMRNLELLSCRCKRIRPHLELRYETWGTTAFATGFLRFLSSFNRGVKPHLMLRHGTLLSSQVEKEVSRPPVELRQGTQAFSRSATGESDLLSCC